MHEQQFGILLLSMIYWSIDTIANVASRYLRREVVVRWFQWLPMSLGSFGRWRQCVCHWSRQVSVWRVLSVPEHVLCLTQPLVATLWWCLDVYRLRRCRPTPETNRHCRRTTDYSLHTAKQTHFYTIFMLNKLFTSCFPSHCLYWLLPRPKIINGALRNSKVHFNLPKCYYKIQTAKAYKESFVLLVFPVLSGLPSRILTCITLRGFKICEGSPVVTFVNRELDSLTAFVSCHYDSRIGEYRRNVVHPAAVSGPAYSGNDLALVRHSYRSVHSPTMHILRRQSTNNI